MADESARDLQKKLLEIKRAGEERSAERVAKATGFTYLDLRKTPASIEAIMLVPEERARNAKVVAIELRIKDLALAVVDPKSPEVQEVAKDLEAQGYKVKIFISSLSGIEQVWHLYKFVSHGVKGITGKVSIEKERLEGLLRELTTLKGVQGEIEKFDFKKLDTASLFEVVLAGALANRASDIHFEAEEKDARVRYRIDGFLHDVFSGLPVRNYGALVSRVKLLSGLKINVRGEAQDGRFTVGLAAKEIEIRVSIIPSEFGETIVMRVLDPDSINIELSDLGLRKDNLEIVERELAKPNGLILNTGPTGSGKTTTLYAFLRHVNSPDIKIITVEDPIEYHLRGVEQTQVDSDTGYTFASGLRSILRQDPDVILVGEIRDLETADIAMQAALTGHLVFSTLHTNDAIGAVPRLIDLGVKVTSVGPALSLVIAQRLVRKLCSDCKKPAEIPAELKEKIKKFLDKLPARVDKNEYAKPSLYEPGACSLCNETGYRGRTAVYEFLEAGPEFEQVILKEASEVALKALADKEQMVTMQEDGILKVLLGQTTFKEVESATGPLSL